MKKISFNSLAPAVFVGHMTAFYVLKSYLAYKGIGRYFDIRLHLFEHDRPVEKIADAVLSQSVDIAAFSVQIWNYAKVRACCRLIKARDPQVFILLGGPYAGFMADALMGDGATDCIVKGAGEETFARLMDKIHREDDDFSTIPNLIFKNHEAWIATDELLGFDLSRLDYPLIYDGDPIDHIAYETSRGCPFRCRYCSWSDVGQRAVTFYPLEKVEKDLTAVYANPKIMRVFIIDSDMFLNQKRGLDVLQCHHRLNGMRKKTGWQPILLECQVNPEFLSEETIDEIATLAPDDLYVGCGLQTIDEDVNNRHLDRRFNKNRCLRNLKLLDERLGRGVGISTIYGLPGETYEGFRKTLDFLLTGVQNKKNYMLQCFRLRVLPGSYLWNHAADYGLVYEPEPPHCLIASNTFSEADMDRAKRLVLFISLFFTVLKEIRRYIDRKISKNRLDVYEKIIDHISEKYPDFVSIFEDLYKENDETEYIGALTRDYTLYKDHVQTRQQIIRESRDIINRL